MSGYWRDCEVCEKRQPVYFDTDGMGHLEELPLECGCETARARVKLNDRRCLDCNETITSDGRTVRCPRCSREWQKGSSKRWRDTHPEEYRILADAQNARRREELRGPRGDAIRLAQCTNRPRKDLKNANRRRQRLDPEKRAEINAKAAEWRKANPESVKRTQDKANEKRRQSNRDWAHNYQTVYVGVGCEPPKCRQCGEEVPWNGRGRPRLDCPACRGEGAV